MPYLDWRPDICTSIHYNVRVCAHMCKNTHTEIELITTHTAAWMRKHQQHPSKLSWPRRLTPALGLRGGYIQWISAQTTQMQRKHADTRTWRPLDTRQPAAGRTGHSWQDEAAPTLAGGNTDFLWSLPCRVSATSRWRRRVSSKMPFNPFLHKIHSKRANEHQVVWIVVLFVKDKNKQNKTWTRGGKKNKIRVQIESIIFKLRNYLFYICKWTHKKNQTSTEIITVGGGEKKVTTLSLHDSMRHLQHSAAENYLSFVFFLSKHIPTPFFSLVLFLSVYNHLKAGLWPRTPGFALFSPVKLWEARNKMVAQRNKQKNKTKSNAEQGRSRLIMCSAAIPARCRVRIREGEAIF